MIVSKPKFSTMMSLSAFLFIAYGLGIWSLVSMPADHVPGWRYWLSGGIFLIALLVTIKVFGGYRTLKLKGDRWQVSLLLRPGIRKFKTAEIDWWKVTTVNTKGGRYEELEIRSSSGVKVKVSPQEHTGYSQVISHLQKKCAKKRLKTD